MKFPFNVVDRYHVLVGKKVFFLVPPSDDNLRMYEEWSVASRREALGGGGRGPGGGFTFFGDRAASGMCARVEVPAGQTLFIPGGWIHAVYAAQDTIMFGGNFLHSFNIEKQLIAANIEDITNVPSKFRFPFFTEILWYEGNSRENFSFQL